MASGQGQAVLPRSLRCRRSSGSDVEKEEIVGKVSPFHSVKETDRQVYHDDDQCTEGNNIEKENKRSGTDGRPKCERCKELSG